MKNKLTIAIDYDDVLALCTQYALDLEEKKGNRIDISEVKSWGPTGKETDVIFNYFSDENFYKTQPLYVGAQSFVKELINRGHEVLIVTAVYPEFAGIRGRKILEEFPEIKKENIVLTSRKDLVQTDILIDDAPHNLSDTSAKYPICFRRPWNSNLTGFVSVFSYEEILSFIDRVAVISDDSNKMNKIYCLLAPSGSGKTAIANELSKDPRFVIPRSTTTRKRREKEPANAYNFVTTEQFQEMFDNGYFLETTVYANNRYGTTKQEIESILNQGKNAVMPIDYAGANALKMKYGEQCEIVYIKRSKPLIIEALLDRMESQLKANPANASEIKADIQNRLLSLSTEMKNEDLCDSVIVNNGNLADVIKPFFH